MTPARKGELYTPQTLATSAQSWQLTVERIADEIRSNFPQAKTVSIEGLNLNSSFHSLAYKDIIREFVNGGLKVVPANADVALNFEYDVITQSHSFRINSRGIISTVVYFVSDVLLGSDMRGNAGRDNAEFILWCNAVDKQGHQHIAKKIFYVEYANLGLYLPTQSVAEVEKFRVALKNLSAAATSGDKATFDSLYLSLTKANPGVDFSTLRDLAYSKNSW